jgi:hypothetical protein
LKACVDDFASFLVNGHLFGFFDLIMGLHIREKIKIRICDLIFFHFWVVGAPAAPDAEAAAPASRSRPSPGELVAGAGGVLLTGCAAA